MSKYISLLKSIKAVVHDGLHAAFLKYSDEIICPPLSLMYLMRVYLSLWFSEYSEMGWY